ncbi:hypothetical protein [Mesorhizobium sp. NZP2077]|uniref:hypothetical protein n=1 Tax=Mesorhizobium sp. NZP2077 TaxID=2483404 RepID=UPI001556EBDE|nr:hypothetical protein [Mesorhizobium sp. NZP2077]
MAAPVTGLVQRTQQRLLATLLVGKRAKHFLEGAGVNPICLHDQPDHRILDGLIYGKIAALWHWPAPYLSIRSPCSRTFFHLFTGRSRMNRSFSLIPIWQDQFTALLLTEGDIGVTSK